MFKGFYENKDKKTKPFCTNKPCGISSEPARSSEKMNLKNIESLNELIKEFFLVSNNLKITWCASIYRRKTSK